MKYIIGILPLVFFTLSFCVNASTVTTPTQSVSRAAEQAQAEAVANAKEAAETLNTVKSTVNSIDTNGIESIKGTGAAASAAVELQKIILQSTGAWNNVTSTMTTDEAGAVAMLTNIEDPVGEITAVGGFIVTAVIPTTSDEIVEYSIVPPGAETVTVKGFSGVSTQSVTNVTIVKDAATGTTTLTPDHWAMGGTISDSEGNEIGSVIFWSNFSFQGDASDFISNSTRFQLNIPNTFSVDVNYANAKNTNSDLQIQSIITNTDETGTVQYVIVLGYVSNATLAERENSSWILNPKGLFLQNNSTNALTSANDVFGFNALAPVTAAVYSETVNSANVVSTTSLGTKTFSNYEDVLQNIPIVQPPTTYQGPKQVEFTVVDSNNNPVSFTLGTLSLANMPCTNDYALPGNTSWAFGGNIINSTGAVIGTVIFYDNNIDSTSLVPNLTSTDLNNMILSQGYFQNFQIPISDETDMSVSVAFTPAKGYNYNMSYAGTSNQIASFNIQLTQTPESAPSVTPIQAVNFTVYNATTGAVIPVSVNSVLTNVVNTQSFKIPTSNGTVWAFGGILIDTSNNDTPMGTLIISEGISNTLVPNLTNTQKFPDVDGNAIVANWSETGGYSYSVDYVGYEKGVLTLNVIVTP